MCENEVSSTSEESGDGFGWIGLIVLVVGILANHDAILERIRSSSWWQERKACSEWHESFPDRRLIEIVRKEVDGQTFDQIGDFYGVSGGCVEKRIDEDRELFDRLKALYISRNY